MVHRTFNRAGWLIVTAWIVALAALSVPAQVRADDTEVFFPSKETNPDFAPVPPNILFVIDTSGSMDEKDGDPQTRLQRVQTAFSSIISGMNQNVNVGLMRYSGLLGGPVMFPVTPIDAYVDTIDLNGAGDRNMQVRVFDNVSEAQETGAGAVTLAPSTLTLNGSTTTSVGRTVGIRFDNVQVPRGVTLTGASILFHSDTGSGTAPTINLSVENASNSAAYTTTASTVSNRSYNSAIAVSGISASKGVEFSSGDMASQLNAIIGSADWCGGNALGFRLTASGGSSATTNYRAIIGSSQNSGNSDSQDGALSAVLNLSFSPADPKLTAGCNKARFGNQINNQNNDSSETVESGSPNQPSCKALFLGATPATFPSGVSGCGTKSKTSKIGLRFSGLNIPKGATISSAYIDFVSYIADTSTPTLLVQAENSANPASFSSTGANTVGNRINTPGPVAASVNWPTTAWSSVSTTYATPDLKALVQAVVNRSDWDSTSNALSFFITPSSGSGQHSAYSYDGSASLAPRLRIQIEGPAGRQTVRQYLQELVNGFKAQGGTPTMGVLYEAARYFRGEEAFYGRTRSFGYTYEAKAKVNYPGSTGSAIQIDGTTDYAKTSRLSHRAAFDYSKGAPLLGNPASCDVSTPGAAACDGQAWTGTTIYKSPITDGCQSNNIILLSDGLPNMTTSTSPTAPKSSALSLIKALPGFTGSCAIPKDSTGAAQTEWQCGNELASYLFTKDQSAAFGGTQAVRTYTIAFGPDVRAGGTDAAGAEFLRNMAGSGGGQAFTASSVAEVTSAFGSIVGSILDLNTTFVAPAVTVNSFNRLTHRNELYFAVFRPTTGVLWPGNLKRYQLFQSASDAGPKIYDADTHPAVDANTGFFTDNARSFWSAAIDGSDVQKGGAASVLSLPRKVYTYTGGDTPSDVDLTLAAHALNDTNTAITAAMLGLPGSASDADRKTLLKWARGVDVLDENRDGSVTDVRRSIGDPLHSEPQLITYGGTDTSPDISIFMGDNQGYLHAFNAADGAEQFAFVPQELLPNLNIFFSATGGYVNRPYGLDGPVTAWVNDVNGNGKILNNGKPETGEFVYLYAGMRRGGRNYYALDVTDRSKPLLKFVIKGGTGSYAELGQTWSRARRTRIRIGGEDRDVLIFSGGYDPGVDGGMDAAVSAASAGRALFVADARSGVLLWWASSSAAASVVVPEMTYSIPASPRAIDIDGDGRADRIYMADTGGQIFRVVLGKDGDGVPSLSKATVTRIAALSGSTAKSAQRFYATPDVALVANGLGNPFWSISVGSGFHEHPLAQVNEDRFYLLRDPELTNEGICKPGGKGCSPLFINGDADLYDATANLAGSADAAKARQAKVDIAAKKGLYIRLADAAGTLTGEKVMSDATTFDGQVLFTTYQPGVVSGNSCAAVTGLSRLYQISVADATPVQPWSQPPDELDDGNATLTAADRSRSLKQSGLPPNPTLLFPAISSQIAMDGSRKVCTGSACLPDQVLLCVGSECFQPGLHLKTLKTYWQALDE